MDLDRPVLAGHDLGGGVAQIAAARASDRFSGLVLTNTGIPTSPRLWRHVMPLVEGRSLAWEMTGVRIQKADVQPAFRL